MKKLIILTIVAQASLAGTVIQKTVCPTITQNASNIISSLQGIESALGSAEECKPIAESIKSVGDIISTDKWKKYRDTVTGKDSEALEGAEIEELETLTQAASESISQVVSRLSQNPSCLNEKSKASTISTISGVVKEVSNVVGSVTGPYGIAVSLTGSLLSKAIDGIDKIFKANKPYNFKDSDEEKIFMDQFCSFVEAKKDVKDFLGMKSRKRELLYLDSYLDVKENDLLENCPLCVGYSKAFHTKVEIDKVLKRIETTANVVNFSNHPDNNTTISRCPQISQQVYTSQSPLKVFYSLLNKYKNPAMSKSDEELITSMTDVEAVLPEIFPNTVECARLSAPDKTQMSYMFNDFLRDDIFPLSETIFGTQLSAFHHLANKKYQSPMGDYIARTIERKIWIKKQLKSIDKKIIEATKPVNREAIIKVDARLTKRMSEDLMPVYIKHLIKTNIKTLKRFNKDFFKFRKHNRSGLSTLAQKLETLKDPSIDSRSYLSAQRKVTDSLHLVLAQTGKVKRFCDYLKYTTTRTGATDKLCEQDVFKIQAYYSALKNFQSEFDAMQAFDLWADENLNILSSRVMDYADSIRAWAERGDERWIEYIDQTEVTVEVNVEQEEQSWFSTDPFSLK